MPLEALDMRSRTIVLGAEVSGIDGKVAASIQNEAVTGQNGK